MRSLLPIFAVACTVLALLMALLSFLLGTGDGSEGGPEIALSKESSELGRVSTDGEATNGRIERVVGKTVGEAGEGAGGADGAVRFLPREPRGQGVLLIRVRDELDFPLEGVSLIGEPWPGTSWDGRTPSDERTSNWKARTDSIGEARVEGIAAGPYRIRATRGPDGRAGYAVATVVPSRESTAWIRLHDRVSRLNVEVIDVSGAPVSGARVELHASGLGIGKHRSPILDRTDLGGRCVFVAAGLQRGLLIVRTDDGRCASLGLPAEQNLRRALHCGGIRLTVGKPSRLRGSVAPIPDGIEAPWVEARLVSQAHAYHAKIEVATRAPIVDGRYAFENLVPGTYYLRTGGVGELRDASLIAAGLHNVVEPSWLVLETGEETRHDVLLAPGARLEGVVRDWAGRPLSGARVHALLVPPNRNYTDGQLWKGVPIQRFDDGDGSVSTGNAATRFDATTDAEGRWALSGLQPGSWVVEVHKAAWSTARSELVHLEIGETRSLELSVQLAGALQGILGRNGSVGVRAKVGSRALECQTVGFDGVFFFDALPPGAHELIQPYTDEVLGQVEIEAGRLSWIDLRRAPDSGLIGRVVCAGKPCEGIRAEFRGVRATSDEDGAFSMAVPTRNHPASGLESLVLDDGATAWRYGVHLPNLVERADSGTLHWPEGRRELRFFDRAGRPCSARLSGRYESAPGAPSFFLKAMAGSSGKLLANGLPSQVLLEVRFPGGARLRDVELVPGSEPLVLNEPVSGTVLVRVLSPDGAPRSGVTITVFDDTFRGFAHGDGDGIDKSYRVPSDLNGLARVSGLPIGSIRVGPQPQSWSRVPPVEPVRVDVREEEVAEVELRFPR